MKTPLQLQVGAQQPAAGGPLNARHVKHFRHSQLSARSILALTVSYAMIQVAGGVEITPFCV